MEELPVGWTNTTIGEVTTPVLQRQPHPQEKFIYIDISSIDRETKQIRNPQELVGEKAPSRARQIVAIGDVLVSMTRPNLNAVAIVPEELDGQIASTGFDVLRAKGIHARWLLYLVRSDDFISAMSELVQGALYPAVRPKDIRAHKFSLAPLNEQNRIVEKLDRLMARSSGAREELERIPKLVERYKQAVLTSAFSGELTKEWREESRNRTETARELLVHLDELRATVLTKKASVNGPSGRKRDNTTRGQERTGALPLPDSWLWVEMERVGQVLLGRQRSPENHTGPHMRPYVRAANITWGGWGLSDVKEMNFDERDFSKFKLRVGDVLINEGSGSAAEVGKPAIWDGAIPDCCFQNTLLCVRPFVEMSEYLYYVILYAATSGVFVEETRGVNIHHIGREGLASFRIPLSPVDEQAEIVKRIKERFAAIDASADQSEKSLKLLKRLDQQTLAKAFRGDLVPQDPNDEPASVLLERIRENRASAPAKKKALLMKGEPAKASSGVRQATLP